jgi:hypothetical protein
MTLQRAQIDVLLENLESMAWGRYRADPADPTLSRDIVQQARALLRVAALDEHLHICDSAQHLLLQLGGESEPARDDGILRVVQPTRDRVPDLGIALVDDPFDLDAYVPAEVAAGDALVHFAPPPHPVRVLGPTPPHPSGQARDGADALAEAERERRGMAAGDAAEPLRGGLTPQQLATLDTMSQFGWSLRFVRRPLFQPPVPVAFDRNRERFVVVEADGSVNEAPDLRLRG